MLKIKRNYFKIGLAAATLLAMAAVLLIPKAANAQFAGTNGRIFFVGGESHLLYSLFPDSSDLYSHGDLKPRPRFLSVSSKKPEVALTTSTAGASTFRAFTRSVAKEGNSDPVSALTSADISYQQVHPVYSPDGTKIAFLAGPMQASPGTDWDPCQRQLYVADAVDRTNPPTQLTDFNFGGDCIASNIDSGITYPTWSADGSKIYLHYNVYATPVCPDEGGCDPASGTKGLLWIDADDGTLNTYVGNVATGGQGDYAVLTDTTPTSNSYDGNGMDISPDNTNIVFANNGNIYIQPLGAFANPLAGTPTKITDPQECADGTEAYYSPYYSPDGQYIVAAKFCGPAESNSTENAIVIMKADGTEERVLIKNSNLANYVIYGYAVPFWSNITTQYNSSTPTPGAPNTASKSQFSSPKGPWPIVFSAVAIAGLLAIGGYWIRTELKKKK